MKSIYFHLMLVLCCCTLAFSLNPLSFTLSASSHLAEATAAATAASVASSSHASSPSAPSWTAQLAPMLSPQAGVTPISSGDYIYIPGSLSFAPDGSYAFSLLLQRYSPSQDAWAFLPPIPAASAYDPSIVSASPASFPTPSLFYFNDFSSLLTYSIPDNAWSSRAWPTQHPPVTVFSSALAAGDFVYIIGGVPVGNDTATSLMWTFDPAAWRFQQAPGALPKGRFLIRSCTDGANIYAAGGITADSQFYNYIDIFNLKSQSWSVSPTPSLPFYPGSTGLQVQGVACTGGLIYVFYGMTLVQTYDPASQQWSILSPAPTDPPVGSSFGTTNFQGKIFAFGGSSNAQRITNYTWQFNP